MFPPIAGASPPALPQGCTCARLRRLTRRITAVYDRELAAAGLRVTQYSLLSVLRHAAGAEGMPVTELAARMDMDRTTLTRNLKPLIDQGHAALASDAQDRRVRRALLTPQGAAALEAARPHWLRAQQEVNRTLGEATVADLHHWLDTVTPAFRPEGEAA
ncbi:MarR family winged helix-turn-helix transcriptional regulator [uncultured Azohydromonas sp.]|jgi:Transcriptional regulators|uniref:MarR family winged helix-turn-helix transcriptional regulator n=1 Tax=uncultured Azohydromonas sp. TaxID=487342 RepID=UPI00260AD18D|nr:MarR family winged helix-turn-helix transcriptional regulator [uncultured Azohydromonas sp.]